VNKCGVLTLELYYKNSDFFLVSPCLLFYPLLLGFKRDTNDWVDVQDKI
jgi:hypothetical protein